MEISPANSLDGVDIYLVAELIKYPKFNATSMQIMQCANTDSVPPYHTEYPVHCQHLIIKSAVKPRTECYLRHHSKVADQFPTTCKVGLYFHLVSTPLSSPFNPLNPPCSSPYHILRQRHPPRPSRTVASFHLELAPSVPRPVHQAPRPTAGGCRGNAWRAVCVG